MKKMRITAAACLLCSFIITAANANIKEGDIARHGRIFMSRILKENPGLEGSIRRAMSGIIRKGSAGVTVKDKFALFLYDSSRNRLSLQKIKYSYHGSTMAMFIVMKDLSDGQLYNLYVEYRYSGKSYVLKDIYFSSVFMDRLKSVKAFFGGD